MPSPLYFKQVQFGKLLPKLLSYASTNTEYEYVIGEVFRPITQAIINSLGKSGRKELADHIRPYWPTLSNTLISSGGNGIVRSLHTQKLAVDLMLFKDGKYCTKTEDYQWLGEYWENLEIGCCWGGRFNDGGHFSIAHDGIK